MGSTIRVRVIRDHGEHKKGDVLDMPHEDAITARGDWVEYPTLWDVVRAATRETR